jgi:hypothetical protein
MSYAALRYGRDLLPSDRTTRSIGLYATISALAALVFAPLLAMSYFAIPDGVKELDTGTVSAWADPGRDLAGGLLTFASADRVYATYTQIFTFLFPAVLLCGWLTRRLRHQLESRLERWGWRLALTGYLLLAVGTVAVSFVLISVSPSSWITNLVFVPFILPGVLLGTLGSTLLGIALLRSSYKPGLTAWLLALAFPLWIVGSFVLGHNSLGLLPLFVAWGVTGWRLWRSDETAVVGKSLAS